MHLQRWESSCRTITNLPLQAVWQVSSYGRICNPRGHISEGHLHPSGYKVANLNKSQWKVHRLVKMSFDGPPPHKDMWQVHHRDRNRANNRLDNLEYVSAAQNLAYSWEQPSRGSCAQKLSKPVMWRPIRDELWTESPSIKTAAEQLRLHPNTVSRCCRQNTSAKGYEFQFNIVEVPEMCDEEWRQALDPATGAFIQGRLVSSLGRLALQNRPPNWGTLTKSGYYQTLIRINSQPRHVLVHQLVAFAFLGPAPTPQHVMINHKDGDKGNNVVANLEYATASENTAHYHEKTFRKHGIYNSGVKPVWSRAVGTEDWQWHPSRKSAATTLQVCPRGVSKCVQRVQSQTRGFEFCTVNNPSSESLPGEQWRAIDFPSLLNERQSRMQNARR